MQGNTTEVILDGQVQQQDLASTGGWPNRGQRVQNYSRGAFSYQPSILVPGNGDLNALQFNWGRAGLLPFAPAPSSGTRASMTGGFNFAYYGHGQPSWNSLSANWLGYSGYDGICIASAELKSAGPEVEAALRQYVECGGSLVIAGPWESPKAWERTRQVDKGLTRFYPGFGECFHVPNPRVNEWSNEQVHAICGSWQRTAEPWLDLLPPTESNNLFPVVEHLTVPVRSMFLLMLVFSLVIGPVNLYVLARRKRRIWLLWTVPVISLLTCLGVLGYMFLSEGWEGHVRTEGFTLLDETTHQATTLGWMAFYTPVVPSDGLHFSPQTELSPQLRHDTFRMHNRGRTIDWTNEQHLASGWLTARVPSHFVVRKIEPRRERVVVRKSKDGTWTMMNGLKADIRRIAFMSASGKIYAAQSVPAGQEALLKATGEAVAPAKVEALRDVYRGDWLPAIQKAHDRPEALLRPGCYVALLEATPFLEEGLRNAEYRQGRSVVYGVMKDPIED